MYKVEARVDEDASVWKHLVEDRLVPIHRMKLKSYPLFPRIVFSDEVKPILMNLLLLIMKAPETGASPN
jgi:hypothetical protein